MKNNLKYIFMSAVAVFGLASCADELIPSKDSYADYKGETGIFAYIVDGTMARYEAVTTSVEHAPDGEFGSVEMTIDLGITKTQSESVTITLGTDDSAVSAGYSAFPEGVLDYNETVTIPAGEQTASVTVSITNANLARLVDESYMAVFRIVAVNGGEVRISSNSNTALLYVETSDATDNIVNLAEASYSYAITNYTNTTIGDEIAFNLSVTATQASTRDIVVEFAVDNDLIAAYNEANGTSYVSIPDGVLSLPSATIAAGGTSASASVSISEEDRARLTDDNGYLIPVVISEAGYANVSSTVVYATVRVTNFDYASDMFSTLYFGNKEAACWYKFDQGIDVTGGFLYAFHIFFENVGQQRVGNIADANENFINMLRLGQYSNGEELEWWVGPNGNRKQLYATVTAGEWHQIGLYYNGDSYILYVDGEIQEGGRGNGSRYDLTEDDKALNSSITFQGIEFANSWGDAYRSGFNGRIWNFAVWRNVSSDDVEWLLSANYKQIIETSGWMWRYYTNYYGLSAYWPMNEGLGSVLYDACGWEDIDLSQATRCNDEVNFVDFDASPYLEWVADENNKLE